MEIKLYHTSSPVNKIGKTFTDETIFECKFKKDSTCDILKPILYIHSENYIDFNYAYIEQFHRYYFVDNVVIYPNNIYQISLNVDVLETYKESILKNTVHVTRKENSNPYEYNTNSITQYQNEKIEISGLNFKLQDDFIVIVNKGGIYQ